MYSPQELRELVKHIWVDFQQMKEFSRNPLIVERGEGIRFWDIDGREFIDGLSGIFVVATGYHNQAIIDAMVEQLGKLHFNPPLHSTNPAAIALAKQLVEITPPGLNTVKLHSGGSEAVEAAFKMAKQYHLQTGNPRKFKIISRYQSFHGSSVAALSATGGWERKWVFEPMAIGFLKVHAPYCYRCPFGKTYPECGITCARIVEDTIRAESPLTVAAFIVDPVMVQGGVLVPPPEYFPIIRDICDRTNVLLIFDEVITGFGRLGKMFAADTFGVVPDIMCLAKGFGSGYAPLSAMVAKDKIAAAFWGEPEEEVEFMHGFTFGGHPVACAAGLANIRQIIDRELPQNAARMGEYLMEKLQDLYKYSIVGDIRGMGLLVGIEFVQDRQSKRPFPPETKATKRVEKKAFKRGLLISASGNTLRISPPLIVNKEDIDEICSIIDASVAEVAEELAGD